MLDEATCRTILFPIAGPGGFNPQRYQGIGTKPSFQYPEFSMETQTAPPKLDEIE